MTRRCTLILSMCSLVGCVGGETRQAPMFVPGNLPVVSSPASASAQSTPQTSAPVGNNLAPSLPDQPSQRPEESAPPLSDAASSQPQASRAPLPERTQLNVPLEVLDKYPLAPGDRLELVYTDQWPLEGDYRLLPGDHVRVEYLHLASSESGVDTELDRTVQVQPDGKIALPYIGMVMAAGATVAELSTELNRRYEEFYVEPQIHASLDKTGAGLKNLWESLRASGSRLVTVAPDGVIGVPFLGPVPAAGLTVPELQQELQTRYTRVTRNLSVTVRLADSPLLRSSFRPQYSPSAGNAARTSPVPPSEASKN